MTRASDVEIRRAELEITRVFNGSPDLLYRLWTDPKYLSQWWGIAGSTIPVCEMDVRPGGRWLIHMRTADGTIYPHSYVYVELVENQRIVFEDEVASPVAPGAPRPAHHTVIFAALAGQTRVTLNTVFASPELRERAVAFGMARGIEQSLDRLETLVASRQVWLQR